MSWRLHAAVGHRVKKRFSPIPRCVKTYGEPEIPCTPKREAKKQSDEGRRERPSPLFALIAEVKDSEPARERNRSRPESDAARQRELRVSAKEEFLKQRDHAKHNRPEQSEFPDARAAQNNVTEGKGMDPAEREHEQGNGSHSPENSDPK